MAWVSLPCSYSDYCELQGRERRRSWGSIDVIRWRSPAVTGPTNGTMTVLVAADNAVIALGTLHQ
jgi:hypothetical protein